MQRIVTLVTVMALALSAVLAGPAGGQEDLPPVQQPPLLPLDARLEHARGAQRVVVHLRSEAVVRFAERGRDAQRAQAETVASEQTRFVERARRLDRTVQTVGRLDTVLNAVIMRADARVLRQLATDPDVTWIAPVVDYRFDLSETVPYVGATALHHLGLTGRGVRIAVLDSGVDYTHAALGGEGTSAAYQAAYGLSFDQAADALEAMQIPETVTAHTRIAPGTFPTSKVIGGYDFVGERWTGGEDSPPERPDPDPIDINGHGTHVADIAAGLPRDMDGDGDIDAEGVAPQASIYAYKICASFAASCSGAALLQAMDAAVDPDGDGDTSDRVEVVNLSLALAYGNETDDSLSQAVENATTVGTLTVGAAGNNADHPYATGTPAASPSALSVAWTQVPSARRQYLSVDGPDADQDRITVAFQPWSAPLDRPITGPVQYGDGAGGNLDGCAPFPPGSLDGRIVLVDRGTCHVSVKVDAIVRGGGIAALIALVDPGEPFVFARGDGERADEIPAFVISQADGDFIKQQLRSGATTATLDPANSLALVGSVVPESSRGPSVGGSLTKPEIAAPGGSVSAIAATGTGYEAFGGTSGATPMVTGAAALLAGSARFKDRSPTILKAALMNTAETDITTDPATGALAPVTRIGAGELRVDRAAASPAVAGDADSPEVALSFGFLDVTAPRTRLTRTVQVRNLSNAPVTYDIDAALRYPDDVRNGAVTVTPSATRITVGPSQRATFDVTLTIDGHRLRPWRLNSGSNGTNGDLLTTFEYDGYVRLTDPDAHNPPLHVPFSVLPRAAADVSAHGHDPIRLRNDGVAPATIDAFTLVATSPPRPSPPPGQASDQDHEKHPTDQPSSQIDLRALGVATAPVDAGVCTDRPSFLTRFAITTRQRLTHADAPASFRLLADTDQDGEPDRQVFTFDRSLDPTISLSDGRNAVFASDFGDPKDQAQSRRFTDHPLQSTNVILEVCADQLGLTQADLGHPISVTLQAVDFFSGVTLATLDEAVTDQIGPVVIRPGAERYTAPSLDVPSGATRQLPVQDRGPNATTGEGILLILDAYRPEGRSGAPPGHESLILHP
jgi:subtilisin family serine protease